MTSYRIVVVEWLNEEKTLVKILRVLPYKMKISSLKKLEWRLNGFGNWKQHTKDFYMTIKKRNAIIGKVFNPYERNI